MNRRFFIRKKEAFRVEEIEALKELAALPEVRLESLELYNVYDVFDGTKEDMEALAASILRDPLVDEEVDEKRLCARLAEAPTLSVAYLEGQYDPRADAAEQCLRLLRPDSAARIRSARLYVFDRNLSPAALAQIRRHLINPVECKEKDLGRLELSENIEPLPLPLYPDFNEMDEAAMARFIREENLAMSLDDLRMVRDYFREEGRVPTDVELRVLDTYWSDHCRHTTFHTELTDIENRSERFHQRFEDLLARYEELRRENGRSAKPRCLMELATIMARDLRRRGKLEKQEISDEINACTVRVEVEEGGGKKPWYFLFKNETHNHPTEIEPFGGAATCLGGAIRDPLSGRGYVYQALRISGAGDINKPLEATRAHKLPQREISRKAALGYSSYGNQIGLATTAVREYVHPAYEAKRLELGAVAAALPEEGLRRGTPRPGDLIILLGGPTGRDGVGGATGSSRAHDAGSLTRSGAEVQKGNPVMERKIQRLFRKPEVSRLIRKCNDFGAGGVSVAVGELADGLDIELDRVPLKYRGLNATEIAISESQERMAVLLAPQDAPRFLEEAEKENLSAVILARVNGEGRLRIHYKGETVLNLKRSFVDLNGASRRQKAVLTDRAMHPKMPAGPLLPDLRRLSEKDILDLLRQPNVGSQEGLQEQFDATIGRSTVLMPLGGRFGKSEEAVSAQCFPVPGGSRTASLMAWGFQPRLADDSPYLMAAYSVVEALSRLTAAGAGSEEIYLSCQEYFRRLDRDEEAWGCVLEALLGLLEAQDAFEVAAIGGKDSMSGSFEDLHVPPTLVSFAVSTLDREEVISLTLPAEEAELVYLPHHPRTDGSPDYEELKRNFAAYRRLAAERQILAGSPLRAGGLIEALVKMSLGNRVGLRLDEKALSAYELARSPIGGLVFAVRPGTALPQGALVIGRCEAGLDGILWRRNLLTAFAELQEALEANYRRIYPVLAERSEQADGLPPFARELSAPQTLRRPFVQRIERPRVLLPVFPGGNCEYDTAEAFRKAGADCDFQLIRNLRPELAEEDLLAFLEQLGRHEILAFSGGFSFGDEPDGSAKFIVNFLRSPRVAEALRGFLAKDRLMLGICNGFQALLKSGFLPGGDPALRRDSDPTLFRNLQNRHVSRIVRTRVASTASPWLEGFRLGQVHTFPVSHGEGRFMADEASARRLFEQGCVAFQYIDESGVPSLAPAFNPNGSAFAIEGLISPDGKILGKMGHPERYLPGLLKNIPEISEQEIFANAVRVFRA